jgi:hypothetical protein
MARVRLVGVNLKGLGDYEPFQKWSGRPRQWGGSGDRVWFGGGVVDGLCELLDEQLKGGGAAVIGCVPWLTSDDVIQRLMKLSGCCVVIDKDATQRPEKLIAADPIVYGLRASAISRLSDLAPAVNGGPKVIVPGMSWEETEHVIEPVRVLGHRRRGLKPLLHAKLLVLGQMHYREDERTHYVSVRFEPTMVWLGSANWTNSSSDHLEVAVASSDPELVRSAAEFVAEVIAFSEPADSQCVGPEPDLVGQVWDDEAFAQAAAEWDGAREPEGDYPKFDG